MTYDEYMQMLQEKIIKVMEQGILPWQAPWKEPENGASGRRYDGLNKILLTIISHDYGGENRFYTFQQASALGSKVKKGEKAYPVIYFRPRKPFARTRKDKDGNPVLDEDGNPIKDVIYPPSVFQQYSVFNATQLDPIPERTVEPVDPEMNTEKADEIIRFSPVSIEYTEPSGASYIPSADKIIMPARDDFYRLNMFYSTAFHEMAHSTGPRLMRDLSGRFGDPRYAREELIAELTALSVCEKCDIRYTNEQSAAYIDSWLHAIKDPSFSLSSLYSEVSRSSRYLQHPEDRPLLRMQSWKNQDSLLLVGGDRYLLAQRRGQGFAYSIHDTQLSLIKEGSAAGRNMIDVVEALCNENEIDPALLDSAAGKTRDMFFPHEIPEKKPYTDYAITNGTSTILLRSKSGREGLEVATFGSGNAPFARTSYAFYPGTSDPKTFLKNLATDSEISRLLKEGNWVPFTDSHKGPFSIVDTQRDGLYIDGGQGGITLESKRGGYDFGKEFVRIFWSSGACIARSFTVMGNEAETFNEYASASDIEIGQRQSEILTQVGYNPSEYSQIEPAAFISLEKGLRHVPHINPHELDMPTVRFAGIDGDQGAVRTYHSISEAERIAKTLNDRTEYTIRYSVQSEDGMTDHTFNGVFDPSSDRDFLSSIKMTEEIAADRQADDLANGIAITALREHLQRLSFIESRLIDASLLAERATTPSEADMAYKAIHFIERQISNENTGKPVEWEGYPANCPDIGWKEGKVMAANDNSWVGSEEKKDVSIAEPETVEPTASEAEHKAAVEEDMVSSSPESLEEKFPVSPDGLPYAAFLTASTDTIPLGRRMSIGEASTIIRTLSDIKTSPDSVDTATIAISYTRDGKGEAYEGEVHIAQDAPDLLSQIEELISTEDMHPIVEVLPVLRLFGYLDREESSARSLLKSPDSESTVMAEFKAYAQAVLDFVSESREKLLSGDMFRIDDHPREADFRYMVPENVDINKISTVYLSGPITADPNYEATFQAAESQLRAVGYDVINPVELVKGKLPEKASPAETWRRAMEMDLSALRSSDAMVILDRNGFESKGMDIEIHTARLSNLPIIAIGHAIQAAKESPAKTKVPGLTPEVSISAPSLHCERQGLTFTKADEILSRMQSGLSEEARHKVSFKVTYTYREQERYYNGFMYLRGNERYEGLIPNIERISKQQAEKAVAQDQNKWKTISKYVVPYFKGHQKVEDNMQIAEEAKKTLQEKLNKGYSSSQKKEERKRNARR